MFFKAQRTFTLRGEYDPALPGVEGFDTTCRLGVCGMFCVTATGGGEGVLCAAPGVVAWEASSDGTPAVPPVGPPEPAFPSAGSSATAAVPASLLEYTRY